MVTMKRTTLGKVPLERAFSKLGIASRTQSRAWIAEGRVSVNGAVIKDPLFPVTPETAKIALDRKPIRAVSWRTVMLYKPKGVVTTRSDEKGRPTVFSLLDKKDAYLHPVGRLDMATTGLLLLTNDTRLSSWLTDPNNQIIRTYLVTVEGLVEPSDLKILEEGIRDQGEILKAERVVLRKGSGKESHLTVELTEGKNREIRRMFEAVGHEVTSLKRVAFGSLQLGKLEPGCYRDVTSKELVSAFGAIPINPDFAVQNPPRPLGLGRPIQSRRD